MTATALMPLNLAERNTSKRWDRQQPFARINCPKDVYGGTRKGGDHLLDGFAFKCGCRDPDVMDPLGQAPGALGLALVGGGALAGAALGAALGSAISAAVPGGRDARAGAEYGALLGAGIGAAAGAIGWVAMSAYALSQLQRTVPSWVHVENTRTDSEMSIKNLEDEIERELQGRLVGSYQTWTDFPLLPYHQYYDWNFHVVADPGYRYIAGAGNFSSTAKAHVIECEWDTGAFAQVTGHEGSQNKNGALYRAADVGWPMTGQCVWLAGRWIYDCGHGHEVKQPKGHAGCPPGPDGTAPTTEETEQSEEKKKLESQVMRAELHPVKALATARWQGVQLEANNGAYVPGIRFTFFASKHGGYVEQETINTKDYEFIVDVPVHPSAHAMAFKEVPDSNPDCTTVTGTVQGRYAIGEADGAAEQLHTRDSKLLIKVDTAPFNEAGFRGNSSTIKPRIEPVFEDEAKKIFKSQVKITIPLTEAQAADSFYGVHIELGWKDDANHTLARRVRKFTVTFDELEKADIDHDAFAEEWQIRYAVNGQWFQTPEIEMGSKDVMCLCDAEITTYLDLEDHLTIAVHGTEHDLVEEKFKDSDADRTVRIDGRPVSYMDDMVRGSPTRQGDVASAVMAMMWTTFGDTGDPLGRIEDISHRADSLETTGPEGAIYKSHPAVGLIEDSKLAETRKRPDGATDYTLRYRITVSEQDFNSSTPVA